MATKKKLKTSNKKLQKKRLARTNKKLLTVVVSLIVVVIIGLGGLWFFVEYKGAARNVRSGDASMEEGAYKAAYKQYGRAVRKEPTNLEYVHKLKEALLKVVPVTMVESRQMYDEYVSTIVHEARYNPSDIDAHLRVAQEMYRAANLTGENVYWSRMRLAAGTGLDRVPQDHPRRHELLLYRGLASLRIEDASMTEAYDDFGNIRFPGEGDIESVLEVDPGNANAWSALAHGRMAVYYRLKDGNNTKQANRNREFANNTLNKAIEVAGDSFEVSLTVLREMLLRRTNLYQKKVTKPSSVSEDQLDEATQKIVDAADQLVASYDPSEHYPRAGEAASLLVATNSDGNEKAVTVLQRTVDMFQTDFIRQYTLTDILVGLGKYEEAGAIAQSILDAEKQPVGLDATSLFLVRPVVAQSLVRLNIEQASIEEDEQQKLAFINEAKQYREILFDLVSGDKNNQLLMYADGVIALTEEDYDKAATLLEEAISRNPLLRADVYMQSAVALTNVGAVGLAIERLRVAIDKDPKLSYYLMKAGLELRVSDSTSAAKTLSVLSEKDRSNEKAQELINLIALQQRGLDKDNFTDQTLAVIAASEDLLRLKKFDKALQVLNDEVDRIIEQDWRLYLAISNVYLGMDEKEEAIKFLEKSIEIAPNPDVLMPRLFTLQSDNRIDATIMYVESKGTTEESKAEELAVSLYELGMTLLGEANRWSHTGNSVESKKAREESKRALEASVTYQELAASLGADMSRIALLKFNQSLSEDNLDKAELLLEELLVSVEDKEVIANSKASFFLAKAAKAKQKGEMDVYDAHTKKAHSIAEQLVQEASISDNAWSTFGRVLVEIGEINEAVDAYAEAYRISPRNKQNILNYVRTLFRQNKDPQRWLRVLRMAIKQFPNDRQLMETWLDAEKVYGDMWKVLVYRFNQYSLNPEDRSNTLELALLLVNIEPDRELIRNKTGEPTYTVRDWDKLSAQGRTNTINNVRKQWDETINEILSVVSTDVDTTVRLAAIHASIHRDLGQLDQSSEIWDRYLESVKEEDNYATATIAAAQFLFDANRGSQAVELLKSARDKQSDRFEIDAALGSMHYLGGLFKEAAEFLKTPAELNHDNVLLSRMIESLAMSGQFEEAERAMEKLTSTNTEYAAAMLRVLIFRVKSEQMLAQGDITGGRAALKSYRDALRVAINTDINSAVPYMQLCKSLLNEYRLTQDKVLLEEALDVADEATAAGQQTEQFVIIRADVLQADGQLDRSIERLSGHLAENPESNAVRERLIEAYLDADNVEKALAVALAGVKRDPSDALWHTQLGDLYLRANDDRGKAVESYLSAIQRDPSVILLFNIDVVTRTDQDLPNQTLLSMARGPLSKLHPISGAIEAKALNNLGYRRDALLAMARTWNKYQHAIQKGWIPPQAIGTWFLDLQTLFKDDPAAGEAFVKDLTNGKITPTQSSGLAAYYKEFGEDYLDKSIEIIDAGLDYPTITSDERAGLLMLRGGLLVESKRYEEGVASFQILANESNSPLVQNNIAYIVGVYQDKPTEGLAIAKGAAKLAPRNPSVIDTVAELYSRIGSYQKAADTLDFLLQLNPSNSIAMAKLSLLYTEHLGDPERGIVYAQRGRSQTPRAPEVLDAMGWGYYRTGKKDLARESIERSILQGDTLNAYLHLAQIVTEDLEFEKALGHIRMAEELTEDAYSMRRIQTLKDDIRKKQTENADN